MTSAFLGGGSEWRVGSSAREKTRHYTDQSPFQGKASAVQRVYTSSDPVSAGLVLSVLEAAGIPCLLRNQYLTGALGELPVNECWPQVWVLDEDDAPRARRLIADALPQDGASGEAWLCPDCGERLEPQFSQCWQCGALRQVCSQGS
ncbi:MAG: DUF2007 domain-containing protein [Proteobacteria bacterium]|nr:DUF2007 domain-containing protein [Pseudomonadota bacterium]